MQEWLNTLIAHEVAYSAQFAAIERAPYGWLLSNAEMPDCYDANRALGLRDDGRGADAVAREVVARLRSRQVRVVVDVDAEAEAQGIGAALRRLGVTPVIGEMALMRYTHSEPPALIERGVAVTRLTARFARDTETQREKNEREEEALRRVWVETLLSDLEGEERSIWEAVAKREAQYSDARLYVGFLAGKPVGTCSLFVAEGWGRVDNVATLSDYRRRGVASALAREAIADSLALGNEETYLFTEAGGVGESVYLRLGFEEWARNPLRRHMAPP